MSVQVNTYGTDDGIVGTLVLTLHDPASEVGTVRFRVTGADGIPSSPVAADRVPSPGVYEKDVRLALDTETLIEPVVTLAAGGTVPAEAQSFSRLSGQVLTLLQGSRTERGSSLEIGTGLTLGRAADGRRPLLTGTGGSGTGGTLAVQDEDTTATPAGTLTFQGAVVSVSNGVATFDLDGRYAQLGHLHDDRYVGLGAAIADSQLSVNIPRFGTGGTWSGSATLTFAQGESGWGGWNMPLVLSNPSHAAIHAAGVNWMQGFHADGHVYWGDTTPATGGYRMWLNRSGNLAVAGGVQANGLAANVAASGTAGGICLYGASENINSWGIAMRQTAWSGTHGWVSGDWTTCFTMDGTPGRGWIFKSAGTGNVASISNAGHAQFNGWVQAGSGFSLGGGPSIQNGSGDLDVYVGSGARVRSSNDGSVKGSLYYSVSGFGLLSSSGHWAFRTDGVGNSFVHDGSGTQVAWFNAIGAHVTSGMWWRSYGETGWFNGTYGGGIYMTDATWVRTYNGKSFVAANVRAEQSLFAADPSTRLSSDNNYWYSTSRYGLRFYGHDGSQKGVVYFDGGSFGLLDARGHWAVQAWPGGGQLYGGWDTDGAFGARRLVAGYDSGEAGSVNASGWFRSSGSTGWYNATHGTGIYAEQSGYVRTYGQSGIKVGSNAVASGNPVEHASTFGLYFAACRSAAYGIYRASGPWIHPYPDLRLAFHTGIQIGANAGYGGTRFYSDYDMATELMSVGNGDGNVRIANTLAVSGSVHVAGNLSVMGTPTDVYGNALGSIHLGSTAPANARPGTLWIQV